MNKITSQNGKFVATVVERNGLFRIRYTVAVLNELGQEENRQVCGTNASIFDSFELAKQEALRVIAKYEDHPEWF